MAESLTNLLAKNFIQRTDVKAVQTATGYMPVYEPWTRADLEDHLAGRKTYGHYLLDQHDTCKLFVFDLDLEETGTWCSWPDPIPEEITDEDFNPQPTNPREDWHDRSHPGRPWYKYQMRHLAELLSERIYKELGIPTACAYSGNKGIHVYGFTGKVSASDAREGGMIVLDSLDCFEPERGKSRFQHVDRGPVEGFRNFTLELYPKQDSLEGKKLGNLVRLPLGVNLKNPRDKTFFLNQTTAHTDLSPHPDPITLLAGGNPWSE